MNPLGWLLGLVLPVCGFSAAEGLPTPPVMDIDHIVRPSTPNTALAAPEGFNPAPDLVTSRYRIPAAQMFPLLRDIAAAQPRTYQTALYPEHFQVHYVVRSAWLNFPDLITVMVRPDGTGSSTIVLYSRSYYGRSDFSVNRRRIETWLDALQAKLPPSNER
jgi:uncharacterized protein (DUF1499 family)